MNKLNNEILGDEKDEQARFGSIRQPTFVVHSQDDEAASIKRVKAYYDRHGGPKDHMWLSNVPHASVVLESPVKKTGTEDTLEEANPRFDEMMSECTRFFETHVANS